MCRRYKWSNLELNGLALVTEIKATKSFLAFFKLRFIQAQETIWGCMFLKPYLFKRQGGMSRGNKFTT